MGTITMELLSDALPGSGEGLAGIVDLDITHDRQGLPYIQARRLKGILLESARHLQDAGLTHREPSDLFGRPGQETGAPLCIGNGRILGDEEYHTLLEWVSSLAHDSGARARTTLPPSAVLDYFTYLRSRTTIDEKSGTAKENTLRTVRVLRQRLPRSGEPLAFLFDVDCPPDWQGDLALMCKVTRSFGVSRSRGLGSIRLTYEPVPQSAAPALHVTGDLPPKGRATITLMVSNVNPLVVTNRAGTHQSSEGFVPGSAVLGVLALRYIAARGKGLVPHMDETFRRLFLDNTVTFSDLTLLSSDGKFRTIPAPVSIQREKDTERYFDTADEDVRGSVMRDRTRLKGGIADDVTCLEQHPEQAAPTFCKVPALEDVSYHHRRPEDASIGHVDETQGGVFYQYESLEAGQLFSGSISGPVDDIASLCTLLATDPEMRVGKSRTAQYGTLHIMSLTAAQAPVRWNPAAATAIDAGSLVLDPESAEEPRLWRSDQNLYVTALSDTVVRDEEGLIEPLPQNLAETLARSLASGEETSSQLPVFWSSVRPVLVGGFSGIWRLPRQQYLAIERGSVMVLCNKSGSDISLANLAGRSYGERTGEGFGRLLFSLGSWDRPIVIAPPENSAEVVAARHSGPAALGLVRWAYLRRLRTLLADHAERQVEKATRPPKKIGVPSSFLSRLEAVVQASGDRAALESSLGTFKAPSRENLKRLGSVLPPQMTTASEKPGPFAAMLEQLAPISGTDAWSQAISEACPITAEEEFSLYKFYYCSVLRALMVKQRTTNQPARQADDPGEQGREHHA